MSGKKQKVSYCRYNDSIHVSIRTIITRSVDQGVTGNLVFAIVAGAFGSAFQHGYNTGVTNAPQLLVESFINQTYYERKGTIPSPVAIELIFSLIVAVFCVGGMAGALCTAYVATKFGRKGGLLYNNVLAILATLCFAFCKMAKSYEMLILGRFLIGVNSGL
jgi:SP family facilitated glucose transporter-like MFS transporter 1